MSDEGARELAIDLVWQNGRLEIRVIHGDRPLHCDTVDPRSATARTRAINKIKAKLPALDVEELDRRLVEKAAQGPPPDADATSASGSSSAADRDPEPAPEPVDGAELLGELALLLKRFVVLPHHGAKVAALWILHTFVFNVFEYTARLLITSPSKRCGKSRFMRLISALCSRPLVCEGITGPALFRSIARFRPTMFIDEADTMLRGSETSEVLRGVINAGHQRGGKVIRCVGEDSEPREFDVFAPMAISMIGRPAGTIEDRSIVIEMRRRMPGEKVDKFEPGRLLREQFLPLVQKCVRWAQDNRANLHGARPTVPAGIDDRAADCWFSLLAIADVAGGDWPDLARGIAVTLMAARETCDDLGVELLHDLKTLFEKDGSDRLTTSSIIAALVRLEERPWPDYRRGQPITPRQIAGLLRPFGIQSKNVRLPDGSVPKGYLRADFVDTWRRYFPERAGHLPSESATALHSILGKDLGLIQSATRPGDVADENGSNSLKNKACSAVADGAGGATDKDSSSVPQPAADELRDLVEAMAAEIGSLPAGTAPVGSEALRSYYRDAAARIGVDAALADARVRYERQLQGEILPLPDQAVTSEFTSDDWCTPVHVIDAARTVLGGIDLDPASNAFAQSRVKARQFFTIDQNGLEQPWCGRVWLNPPYSQPGIDRFVRKLLAEVGACAVTAALLLTNSQSSAAWFQLAMEHAAAVCFLEQRLAFERPDGSGPQKGNRFAQVLFYFGLDVHLFRQVFGEYGSVLITGAGDASSGSAGAGAA